MTREELLAMARSNTLTTNKGDGYVNEVVIDNTQVKIYALDPTAVGNDVWEFMKFDNQEGAEVRTNKLNSLKNMVSDTRGEQGEPGTRGSVWALGTGNPTPDPVYRALDMYINTTTYDIFVYNGQFWSLYGNIKGVDGAGIYPQGEATVAQINAFTVDPKAGAIWIMLDSGTVTYGSKDVDVVVDDWLGWGEEGYFVQMDLQGPTGEPGELWHLAAADPIPETGIDGDIALNISTSDYFEKRLGVWALVGNLQGIQGPNGPIGPDGPTGPDGPQGVPGLGVYLKGDATVAFINGLTADPAVGDTWVMTDAGTLTYGIDDIPVIINDTVGWADDGSFTNLGPIVGPAGPIGPEGPDGPIGPEGPASTVPGPSGKTWFTSTVDPIAADGVDGDLWMQVTTDHYWSKAAGLWTDQGSLIGPEGPVGPTGPTGPEGVAVPIGCSLPYSGLIANIPSNFQIDMDMVNMFILGTDTDVDNGTTGGSADAINVEHSHTFTGVAMDPHSHAGSDYLKSGSGYTGGSGIAFAANTSIATASAGTPSGTISTDGASGVGANLPPYVKKIWIIRVS